MQSRTAAEQPVNVAREVVEAPTLARIDALVIVLAVVLFSGAVFSWLQRVTADPLVEGGGNPVKQAVAFSLYAYAAVRLLGSWRTLRDVLPALLPVMLFVALAAASALWSDAGSLALRRTIALSGTMIFGLFVASRTGAVRGTMLVGIALGCVGLLSAVVALFLPSIGREVSGAHEGLWIGLFHHKNSLGTMMAVGLFTAIATYQASPRNRTVAAAMGVMCFILVLASGSTTALLLSLGVPSLVVMIRIFGLNVAARWSALLVLISLLAVIGGIVVTDPTSIFQAVGKDATLSGRSAIWFLAATEGVSHMWLGTGFDVFWRVGDGPGDTISRVLGFRIHHAHNSFIDIWLSLGLIGLAIVCLTIAVPLRDAWRTYKQNGSVQAQWAMIFLGIMLIMSLSESVIAVQHHLFWFLHIAFTVWARRGFLSARAWS